MQAEKHLLHCLWLANHALGGAHTLASNGESQTRAIKPTEELQIRPYLLAHSCMHKHRFISTEQVYHCGINNSFFL